MDNSQYNRETLASGYWVLHNYHYGHVAQARCDHKVVKSLSLHKAPSDDKLKVSFDLAAMPNQDDLEIVIHFANGEQLVVSDFIDYRCQRGLTQLVRCLIPANTAAHFYDQAGFSVVVNQSTEHIVTDGAKDIISNAIRFS